MKGIVLLIIAMMIFSLGIVTARIDTDREGNATAQVDKGIKATVGQGQNRMNYVAPNLKEAKEKYQGAKSNFQDARRQFLECKNIESEECDQKRNEITKKSQDYAARTVDKAIKMLQNVKERIQESSIDEEIKNDFITKIDEKIVELEKLLESLSDEEINLDQIRRISQEVQKEWQKAQAVAKRAVIHNANMKLGNAIDKSNAFIEKVSEIIAKMEENDYDTSKIKNNLEKYQDKIKSAADAREQAITAYKSMESGSAEEANKARVHMNKALSELKEAHKIMKDITGEIRSYMKESAS